MNEQTIAVELTQRELVMLRLHLSAHPLNEHYSTACALRERLDTPEIIRLVSEWYLKEAV